MKKLVGYIVSGVGLVVMIIGIGNIKLDIAALDSLGETVILGAGIAIVLVGVALSMMDKGGGSGSVDHAQKEVPIYEGKGKNRKIVGYHRSKD